VTIIHFARGAACPVQPLGKIHKLDLVVDANVGGRHLNYTFVRLAAVIDRFTETLGLNRYAIYIFDYGAPVGLCLALAHPERITAIISQNGNAYEEGLSQGWNPIQ
jgi:pimeloyl-ACP methyl ester carboxylesterase